MNTKKLLPLALLPIGIIPLITISCSTQPENIYTFEAEGLKIGSDGEIMGFVSKNTHIGPLEIKEEYNGVIITKIAQSAFRGEQIEGLILPKTLVKIASWAFEGIKSPVANTGETSVPWDLSHLTNLEYIGRGVFDRGSYNAKKLNLDLNLSGLSKLKVIDDSVFSGLGLTSVDLRGLINLEEIKDWTFSDNLISKIYWPEDNKIKSIGSAAFLRNQLTELNFVSLDLLESIGSNAFAGNSITSILWNNFSKIKTIGKSAFAANELFGELDLHDLINLESVEEGVFSKNKISSIIWPINSKISSIGESAFESNAIAGELNLLALTNLKSIGINSFRFNDISSIQWPTPSQIKSIGLGAFAVNNFGLNIPTFPDGLTTETNGGITPEQIFTNKVKKLPPTN